MPDAGSLCRSPRGLRGFPNNKGAERRRAPASTSDRPARRSWPRSCADRRRPPGSRSSGCREGRAGERLLADARTADSLPLLQFTLRRLYEQRADATGEAKLTHAAYDALGGLEGAIAAEAVDALLKARILIARTDAAGRPTVRLAHDAVLVSWPRAAAARRRAATSTGCAPTSRTTCEPRARSRVNFCLRACAAWSGA